jgi:uncharacterized protein (TIGR01777 family)
VDARAWDSQAGPPSAEALRGVDVVVNLAGEPVSKGRWSAEKKRRIRDSRVIGTRNLVTGLAGLEQKPRVLISASAVGYYGDCGDEELDESSPAGEDFLAQVCADWETEAKAAAELGIRVVCVRIGIVLAPDGGALAQMLTPFKLGVGGRLGSGKQWMPWIHIDDLVGIVLHAIGTEQLHGPVNAVSPNPVTNSEFTRTMGRVLHRPTFIPMPKTALRIAMGRMSEILTASQRALPRVAEGSGYVFDYPNLEGALEATLTRTPEKAQADHVRHAS